LVTSQLIIAINHVKNLVVVSLAWDWLCGVNLEFRDISPFFNDVVQGFIFSGGDALVDEVSDAQDEIFELFEDWLFLSFGLFDFVFNGLDCSDFILEIL
jgi:hypothetical protein